MHELYKQVVVQIYIEYEVQVQIYLIYNELMIHNQLPPILSAIDSGSSRCCTTRNFINCFIRIDLSPVTCIQPLLCIRPYWRRHLQLWLLLLRPPLHPRIVLVVSAVVLWLKCRHRRRWGRWSHSAEVVGFVIVGT